MGNTTFFIKEIGIAIVFFVTLFILYRVLVKQKDATIEKKDATIELLKEKKESLEAQLRKFNENSPDVLYKRLSDIKQCYENELKHLSEDQKKKTKEFQKTEQELKVAKEKLEQSNKLLEEVKEESKKFFCPYCKAPLAISEPVSETDGESYYEEYHIVQYECGHTLIDGEESSSCGNQ